MVGGSFSVGLCGRKKLGKMKKEQDKAKFRIGRILPILDDNITRILLAQNLVFSGFSPNHCVVNF